MNHLAMKIAVLVLVLAPFTSAAQELQMPSERTGEVERFQFNAGVRTVLRPFSYINYLNEVGVGPEIALSIRNDDPYTRGDYIQYRLGLYAVSGSFGTGEQAELYARDFTATRVGIGLFNIIRSSPTALGWYGGINLDFTLDSSGEDVEYSYGEYGYSSAPVDGSFYEIELGLAQAFNLGGGTVLCLLGARAGLSTVSDGSLSDGMTGTVGGTFGLSYNF